MRSPWSGGDCRCQDTEWWSNLQPDHISRINRCCCRSRNSLSLDAQREDYGKKVGSDVIKRFLEKLEPPGLQEGIDEIWVVGSEGELQKCIKSE